MEQPPTEVINREANLKAVKQLLKGVNSTIKAIRKTDDCRILEYIQQQIQDLLIYIRQDLTTIEVTGTYHHLKTTIDLISKTIKKLKTQIQILVKYI